MFSVKLVPFMSYVEFMALMIPVTVVITYLTVSKTGLQWNETANAMVPYKKTGIIRVLKAADGSEWTMSIFFVFILASGGWFYMKTNYLTADDIARFSNQGQVCELRELASMKSYESNQPFTVSDYEAAKANCEFKSAHLNDKEIMELQREILSRMGYLVGLIPENQL